MDGRRGSQTVDSWSLESGKRCEASEAGEAFFVFRMSFVPEFFSYSFQQLLGYTPKRLRNRCQLDISVEQSNARKK